MKTKSNYLSRVLLTKKPNDQYKNTLNKMIRFSKRRYFHDYFTKNLNNIKKSWAIRVLVGKKKKIFIHQINISWKFLNKWLWPYIWMFQQIFLNNSLWSRLLDTYWWCKHFLCSNSEHWKLFSPIPDNYRRDKLNNGIIKKTHIMI